MGYFKKLKPEFITIEPEDVLEKTMKMFPQFYRDYKDGDIPEGAIVLADPPYANTTGYSLGKFDSDEFWEYMREISKKHTVLICEQTAPNDFECVWKQELMRILDVNKNNNFKITEKLFKWKG